MPLAKIQIRPGIDKQRTEYGAEGTWIDGDNVRFRSGLPEKIGGWLKITSDALIGATRALLTWVDLDGVKYTMFGTNKKLYVYSDILADKYYDATPTRGTGSITQFNTTSGSTTITVTDGSHGARVGDYVTISSVSADVGGVTQANLQNEFEILTLLDTSSPAVVTANTFTITSPAAATSTASGATATATYKIRSGPATSIYGYGWGMGVWNQTEWGDSREDITASPAVLESGKWSLDNWGEDALACQLNGGLYTWDTSSGLSGNLATVLSNAPTTNRIMLISGDDRHVILFGTETTIATSSTQDNMFIRWCDQENNNTWTPTATNTAGSQRLTRGSQIMAAVRSRGVILVFTDTSLYQMQFIGPPFTFGFKLIADNCGAVGMNAAIDIGGRVFWMGKESFFVFDGAVKKLDCTVQDHVFDDIEPIAQQDVFCSTLSDFGEVMWFYPSSDSVQLDKQVTYNYQENSWHVGSLARSAWADRSAYNNPYAAEYDADDTTTPIPTVYGATAGRTFFYKHEFGKDADGSAMTSYIESADVDLEDGEKMMSIKRFIPDFKNLSGSVDLTLKFRDYPSSTQRTNGPYEVTTSTNKIDTRARGRQAALRIESDATGDDWRFGTFRAEVRPDGGR